MKNVKIGDKVVITNACDPYFQKGCIAVLTKFDGDDWWGRLNQEISLNALIMCGVLEGTE